jgi:orotidine-5'-phosphate decarboxylase
MPDHTERLIIALDFPNAAAALELVDSLGPRVIFYKVGMQLYFAEGNNFLDQLRDRGKRIFLDLKLNDIPETVGRAVESISRLGVEYLTLFTDAPQIEAAAKILREIGSPLKLLNVTVLTSDNVRPEAILQRAQLSAQAGAHGIICSGQETAAIRKQFGSEFIVVNPGIRPLDVAANDQVRTVTPEMAMRAGATNIVVGRPITRAEKPLEATEAILAAIAKA